MLTGPPTHRAPRRGPPAGSQSRSVRWALTAGELASSRGGTLLLSFCGGVIPGPLEGASRSHEDSGNAQCRLALLLRASPSRCQGTFDGAFTVFRTTV